MDITAQLALRLFTRRSGKNAQLGQTISLPVTYLDQEGLRRGANATGQVSAAARRDAETRGGLTQLGCVYPTARRKKTEVSLCFFIRASQASRPGFRLAPRVVSPHPRWVANCYLCRLSATLCYLSTLPPASPSLPSAVGHSSVAVGIGNITKKAEPVNRYRKQNQKNLGKPDERCTRDTANRSLLGSVDQNPGQKVH